MVQHKGDGTRACDIMLERFKRLERPQLHKLIAQLTSFKKTSSESIVDYLTRADDMQYNLTLVNEGISEKIFFSIILKKFSKEYEKFATLVKYSKTEKTLEEIKQNLIKFDNENVKTKTESFFKRIPQKGTEMFQLPENGTHRKRMLEKTHEQIKASPMKLFKCGEQSQTSQKATKT